MERVSRRRLLQTAGAAVSVGLAGCLGGFGLDGGTSDAITLERAAGTGPDAVALVAPDRPIVLDFFATWCAPCIPQLETIWAVAQERPDVHYVSITAERDRDAIRQWWETYGGDWPAVMDPEARAQSAYSAPRLPTTLVLPPGGGPGAETWRHVGVARADALLAAIEDAANTATKDVREGDAQ
jgi:thiol-disulfide isomerase/thioredoxin